MVLPNDASLIPLALYIHFPWCIKKCPYCDFNSHAVKTDLSDFPEQLYIKRLIADLKEDIKQYKKQIENRKIVSIFMGGGTPSLFSPESLKILFDALKNLLEIDFESIEITLEANPGTFEQAKFDGYRAIGINRLSLGIQSFQSTQLKALGRIHDSTAARQAIESAKKAGFSNFNLDIMHGLPHQTLQEGLEDIAIALNFAPPHLSYYQLTLEPNTLFYQQPPPLPGESLLESIEVGAKQLLLKNHFHQYEISAFCQQGFECRHNRNYWEFGDYLGIGAGAHGKITDLSTGQIIRTIKHKHPKSYLNSQNNFTLSCEIVEKNKIPFEFMLNSLRLLKPISWQLFSQRTFLDKSVIQPVMETLEQQKLMKMNQDSFEPTALGRRFLNTVQSAFLTL